MFRRPRRRMVDHFGSCPEVAPACSPIACQRRPDRAANAIGSEKQVYRRMSLADSQSPAPASRRSRFGSVIYQYRKLSPAPCPLPGATAIRRHGYHEPGSVFTASFGETSSSWMTSGSPAGARRASSSSSRRIRFLLITTSPFQSGKTLRQSAGRLSVDPLRAPAPKTMSVGARSLRDDPFREPRPARRPGYWIGVAVSSNWTCRFDIRSSDENSKVELFNSTMTPELHLV